jgi:hypothetical protein
MDVGKTNEKQDKQDKQGTPIGKHLFVGHLDEVGRTLLQSSIREPHKESIDEGIEDYYAKKVSRKAYDSFKNRRLTNEPAMASRKPTLKAKEASEVK